MLRHRFWCDTVILVFSAYISVSASLASLGLLVEHSSRMLRFMTSGSCLRNSFRTTVRFSSLSMVETSMPCEMHMVAHVLYGVHRVALHTAREDLNEVIKVSIGNGRHVVFLGWIWSFT